MSDVVAIDLLRHGDTGCPGFRGQLDDVLTDAGREQMREAVAGRRWDAIVSSPLARCVAFARWKAGLDGVPLHVDPRLMEFHFGEWQSMSMEALAVAHGDALGRFWADPETHPPPGGETLSAFRTRLTAALDAIARAHAGEAVLVVTHGGAIRLLRCLAEGRPASQMAMVNVPHASLHRLDWPCASGSGA